MNYRTAREILSEAIEQLDEADGNPAPFGYHVKKSPSGRKRYIPKTQKDFDSARKKFYAKYPGGEKAYWGDINRRQREANHANRGEIAESFEQLDEGKPTMNSMGFITYDNPPKGLPKAKKPTNTKKPTKKSAKAKTPRQNPYWETELPNYYGRDGRP